MSKPCIYCGNQFDDARGVGDHVLSASLFGEFEGAIAFRGVCPRCNHKVGKREQMLAQSSQFGYFRWLLRPKRRRRPNSGLVQRGAGGAPPPVFTMTSETVPMLVEPTSEDPTAAHPVDQILVLDKNGKHHQIRWFNGMTSERIKRELAAGRVGEIDKVWFECDAAYTEEMKATLASAFPTTRIVNGYLREPGSYAIATRAEFEVSTWYFQALAKIAFHYFLTQSRRGFDGSEAEFAAMRHFIMSGGDKEQFFHSSGCHIMAPFGEIGDRLLAPAKWCHVFAYQEMEGAIVVFMQFFVGPEHVGPPVFVTLGRIDSPIVLPVSCGLIGHVFLYEPDRDDRFAGRVEELSLHRIR
jgi:hypothetical protein